MNRGRWAADFLLTGRTPEVLTQEGKPLGEECLRDRGLRLAPEKTRLTHRAEGCDFLGTRRRNSQGKCFAIPSQKTPPAVWETSRGSGRSHEQGTAGHLIGQRN